MLKCIYSLHVYCIIMTIEIGLLIGRADLGRCSNSICIMKWYNNDNDCDCGVIGYVKMSM